MYMYMNIYMCVCMSVCVELSVNTGTYIYTYNNSNSTGSDLCRPLKSTRAHTHVKKEKKKRWGQGAVESLSCPR